MKTKEPKPIHPLLQEIIRRLEDDGAGEVVIAPDGHVFFQPGLHIECLWGAMDMKKEGEAAGVRVIIRRIRKRGKRCKYAGLPWYQIYVLPIVEKNAKTMTDAERRNIELHSQALKMAHAVERNPEQAAKYHELHEAHKKNPEGYKKLYPNFFGFLVATVRMQLEAQEAEKTAQEMPASDAGVTDEETITGIRLCVPVEVSQPTNRPNKRIFRPFIRLPMVA